MAADPVWFDRPAMASSTIDMVERYVGLYIVQQSDSRFQTNDQVCTKRHNDTPLNWP